MKHESRKSFFDDDGRRLKTALAAALFLNLLLWRYFGGAILGQAGPAPSTIEIQRIVLSKQGHKTAKTISPKQIARKVAGLQRQIKRRRVRLARLEKTERRPTNRARPPRPRNAVSAVPAKSPPHAPPAQFQPAPATAAPGPEGAHHRVLTAKGTTAPEAGMAFPGGHATPGQPLDRQSAGDATMGPQGPAAPEPAAEPPKSAGQAAEPPPAAPTAGRASTEPPRGEAPSALPQGPPAATRPEPPPTPRPEPAVAPRPTPKPDPPEPPKPKGPTRDAEATRTVQPRIPDDLRRNEFKTSVSVRVEISADGSASLSLRGTSGNAEIDERVLSALRRWRWKPALKDGEAVASTKKFRFDFEVR